MAQVFLYPATGESPLDEDGNPFPSTGLRVTMNAYYEGQCRQGLLVRQDPSAFSAVAQPAVYAPYSLGYVTTQLATLPGGRDDRYVTTIGYAADADGGGATFRFAAGVSSGADTYTKINTSDGQWQMLWPGNDIDARCFGLRVGSSAYAAANVTALNAGFAAIVAYSLPFASGAGRLRLPAGKIYVNANFKVRYGCTLSGESGSPLTNPATMIVYYGSSGRTTVSICSPKGQSIVENLGFRSELGQIHSAVAFDQNAGATDGITTNPILRNCSIECLLSLDTAEMDHGVTINTLEDSGGNIENGVLDNVCITNPRISHIKVGNRGGQPLGWVLTKVSYTQNRGQDALGRAQNTPYGWGVWNENALFEALSISPKIGAVGIWDWNQSGEHKHTIIQPDSEYLKSLVRSNGGYAYGAQPFVVIGGRFAVPGRPGIAAYDENNAIIVAAADEDFVKDWLNRPISMDSVSMDNNGTTSNLRISVSWGTPLTLTNCYFPNLTPVSRRGAPWATELQAYTTIVGCKGAVGPGVNDTIPQRDGCENEQGTVTITGAATMQAVTFALSEVSATYRVVLFYLSETGAPAPASRLGAYATSRTTTGFTANVGTAPGVGNTVTYGYRLELTP